MATADLVLEAFEKNKSDHLSRQMLGDYVLNYFPSSFAEFSRKKLKVALQALATAGKVTIHSLGASYTLNAGGSKAASKAPSSNKSKVSFPVRSLSEVHAPCHLLVGASDAAALSGLNTRNSSCEACQSQEGCQAQ